MRCLYCGKELALLKRLRGGGEFCSDAHRQQYQEEYNQLALTRLLQAQPSEDSSRPATPLPVLMSGSGAIADARGLARESRDSNGRGSNRPVTPPLSLPPTMPLTMDVPHGLAPAPPPSRKPEAPVREPEPQVAIELAAKPEEKAPAPLAKFIAESFPPSEPAGLRSNQEPERLNYLSPALPLNESALPLVATGRPDLAGTVPLRSSRAVDSHFGPRARAIEQRDFSHAIRATNTLSATPCDGSLGRSQDPLEIEMSPFAPPKAAPWTAPECRFALEIELGDWTRLAFTTAGFAEERETPRPPQHAAVPASQELSVEPAVGVLDELPAAASEESTGVAVELLPQSPAEAAAAGPAHAGSQSGPSQLGPSQPSKDRAQNDVPSGRVTERLPVPIRTVAAGRGRPVQVFSAPVVPATEIQIPASGAMPLRPLMVLGSPLPDSSEPGEPVMLAGQSEAEKAPVEVRTIRERPAVVRPQGQKSPAEKPQSEKGASDRTHNDKPKPTQRPRIETDRKSRPLETKAAALSLTSRESEAENESETEAQAHAKRADRYKGSGGRELPKPLSAPLTEVDLRLPELHMDTQAGFWSRLSIVGKIGIGAAIVVVATAATYMVSGGHATATPANQVRGSIQPGPPITDAAWMADWSPEAARRGRHISILKSSLPLTDYRMQFEAQIETKAIAWVYRAEDTQNYNVAKIEVVKPGLEPVVALVRFAVVRGQDQPRTSNIIPMKVRVDTLYKVRFEAVGNRFTTWIGDLKVGEWTDDRFTMGPPGLFNDKGESAAMQGNVNVMPLMVSNGVSK